MIARWHHVLRACAVQLLLHLRTPFEVDGGLPAARVVALPIYQVLMPTSAFRCPARRHHLFHVPFPRPPRSPVLCRRLWRRACTDVGTPLVSRHRPPIRIELRLEFCVIIARASLRVLETKLPLHVHPLAPVPCCRVCDVEPCRHARRCKRSREGAPSTVRVPLPATCYLPQERPYTQPVCW